MKVRQLSGAAVSVAMMAIASMANAQAPATPAPAAAAKPSQPAVCNNCHKPAANAVSGYFDNVAFKSQSIQLDLAGSKEIVRFDPKALKVVDAGDPKKVDALREIKKGHEARIDYVMKDGEKWATAIAFKGPIKTPPEKLVNFEQVAKLVAQGPDKASYTLIDSRPLLRFQEGTIPTAINLPYPSWDKFVHLLPKDKNRLTVFFCQGVTCMMSPMSMRKAEALGYTNLKVYREGVPEWQTKDYLVTSPQFVKAAYVDKGIPAVFIDARSAVNATAGHVVGAVNVPPSAFKNVVKSLPDVKFKAPFIVYDARGGEEALALAAEEIPFRVLSGVTSAFGGLASAGIPATMRGINGAVILATGFAATSDDRPDWASLARTGQPIVIYMGLTHMAATIADLMKGGLHADTPAAFVENATLPEERTVVATLGTLAEAAHRENVASPALIVIGHIVSMREKFGR